MHPPELGGTEPPARSACWAHVPSLVDELVWDERIQHGEVLGGACQRQSAHGREAYPFETVASGFSFQSEESSTTS